MTNRTARNRGRCDANYLSSVVDVSEVWRNLSIRSRSKHLRRCELLETAAKLSAAAKRSCTRKHIDVFIVVETATRELPNFPPSVCFLSLSFPRRLCQFPTIPRRRSAKLCYFGLHEELCASYAPQWDYVADDLLLRESSVPSGPACPVTLMDLSPSHFRFNILINFPRILEVAIDVSCDLDGRKF